MRNIARTIQHHLGVTPSDTQIVRQDFETYERPNLHLAIEDIARLYRAHPPMGVVERDYPASLGRLISEMSTSDYSPGPVEFVDVEIGLEERLACVKRGVYLMDGDGAKLALLIGSQPDSYPPKILVEVAASDRAAAEICLRRLVQAARTGKAYRGKVFSLDRDCYGGIGVKFHALPEITRNQIVLPEALLQRLERHAIGFARHAERLRESKRHLKRGMLLHGPPGTGKTLCAMYLATRLRDRTVIILTGSGMGSFEAACRLARLLAPSTVILEDVDLIGTERQHQTVGANALLFEMLNQMDGLATDCDVLFLLTTNRPDVLEPALSSRPGRIDQALEVPLPDADCRRRLIELYADGLELSIHDSDSLVTRLEGASAAFIRELLRKAALFAAEDGGNGKLLVTDVHIDSALSELLVGGGRLTQALLGGRPPDL